MNNNILKIFTLVAILSLCSTRVANAQFSAVRGNVLMLATGTVNMGASFNINSKLSVDIAVAGNFIPYGDFQFKFGAIQPGLRIWLRQTEYGHFFSPHLTMAYYDSRIKGREYIGWAAGAGVSYGYCWPLKKRLSIAAEIGASVMYCRDVNQNIKYDHTVDHIISTTTRVILAPTKFEVSLVYLF